MSNLLWIIVIVLLIGSIGGAPHWGYHNYGYYPSGGMGLLFIILLVLLLTGKL